MGAICCHGNLMQATATTMMLPITFDCYWTACLRALKVWTHSWTPARLSSYKLTLFVCLFVLFVLRLNVPVNMFSHAGTEPTLYGFNQYCRELMCLAQGQNTVTPVGSNPGSLYSESDALPLHHCAP